MTETAPYVCMSCNETFSSEKLWDEHLNDEHPGWNAGGFRDGGV